MDLPTEAEPVKIIEGDCLTVLRDLPDGCTDAVITDPPYGLEFMGKEWDSIGGGRVSTPGIGDRDTPCVSNRGWNGHRCQKCGHLPHGGSPCRCESPDIRPVDNRWQRMQAWYHDHFAAALRVLKPGGYAAVFGGTRTYHRLACAVEDAGFEVRDCLMWVYGTGFPKGTGCLKPAYEPILLCRRPGPKVLPLGVDECRVPAESRPNIVNKPKNGEYAGVFREGSFADGATSLGRWPANVLHDGSDEVLGAFAAFGPTSTTGKRSERSRDAEVAGTTWGTNNHKSREYANEPPGTAARFFYCAKASKADRGDGNTHPTVKPVALMRWLVRLVCPAGGLVLDPFGGSGTTGVAALAEARRCLLVERMPEYVAIARRRTARPVNDLFATA